MGVVANLLSQIRCREANSPLRPLYFDRVINTELTILRLRNRRVDSDQRILKILERTKSDIPTTHKFRFT